jgi:2-(1,2-epoxy-1,2-dihydrophenyl)acetyl-CoA isomerase
MSTDFQHLLVVDTDRGVRTIILNRPERLNAVNAQLAVEFPQAMAEAAQDDTVRVVVVAGAGRGFCAGLDLTSPARPASDSRHERLDDLAWVGRWVLAVTTCDKPVVAAVHGAAAGAGLGLACACDIRLLSANAKLTTGYVRRGLSPDAGVSWFLPRLVGQSRAAELILTARDFDAAEALAMGLATHMYDDEAFADEVAAYADQLARGAPIGMALAKRLIHQSADTPLMPHLRNELTSIKQAFQTKDVAEAMQAFVQKRPPTFRGE